MNAGLPPCPADCGRVIPEGFSLFCPVCWWKIPTKDRALLGNMHRARQDTSSKILRCVQLIKGKARK